MSCSTFLPATLGAPCPCAEAIAAAVKARMVNVLLIAGTVLLRGRNAERKRMVGTGRFELPTPRTPSECSTRLSHVPTLGRKAPHRAAGVIGILHDSSEERRVGKE